MNAFNSFLRLFLFASVILFGFSCDGCGGDDDPNDNCSDFNGNEDLTYEYYNETSPFITSDPIDESNNVFYGTAQAEDTGNGVEIRIPGVRVRTDKNNYEITKFVFEENDGSCFIIQSEFITDNSSFKTDIASVLVLDMSTSLESIINELKSYAKEYANTIVNSSSGSQVAVIFFSDRDAIEETAFYDSSNISDLLDLIDNFTNYQNRTALFEATIKGIDKVNNTIFDGEKSLVVFTDGGDNDSNNPTALQTQIQASDVLRFTIGLRGDDFSESDLNSITSPENIPVLAEGNDDLEGVFEKVGRGVISVYEVIYDRSDQILTQQEKIKIRIQMETQKIE